MSSNSSFRARPARRPVAAFRGDASGSTAILFALCLVPMVLAGGMALDYSRLVSARSSAQTAVDAAALAAAASEETMETKLEQVAEDFFAANMNPAFAKTAAIDDFSYDPNTGSVNVSASGTVEATFMRVGGFGDMRFTVEAAAIRGFSGSIEVALVLDNTSSMEQTTGKGRQEKEKIDSLKESAALLVNQMMKDPKADVRIALIPYADYVNVGTANRGKSWLSVPSDYQTCTKKNGKTICTDYRWFGCVGSRTSGTLRLSDEQPSIPYPGFLDTARKCPTELKPLSADKATILAAIGDMKTRSGDGSLAYTYIPGGLIWGVNALSPTEPLAEGLDYDPKNKKPKKAMVLMTDGENTLGFDKNTGQHLENGNISQANSDSLSICTYAKSHNIEVFTIAFAVSKSAAKKIMENCASDADHYFDAADNDELTEAFSQIAKALSKVHLTN